MYSPAGGRAQQEAWEAVGTLLVPPFLGLHVVLSAPDQAFQARVYPALCTSCQPSSFLLLAPGLGRAGRGLFCLPLPQRHAILLLTFSLLPQPCASCFPQGEFLLPAGVVGTIMNGCSLAGGLRRECKENSTLVCSLGQASMQFDTKGRGAGLSWFGGGGSGRCCTEGWGYKQAASSPPFLWSIHPAGHCSCSCLAFVPVLSKVSGCCAASIGSASTVPALLVRLGSFLMGLGAAGDRKHLEVLFLWVGFMQELVYCKHTRAGISSWLPQCC